MKIINVFIIFFLFISCKNEKREKKSCIYTIENFKNENSKDLFSETKYENNYTEIIDKNLKENLRGIFKFDEKKRLRFYAFLIDTSNEANFFIEFDTLGKFIQNYGSSVIQWLFIKKNIDTVSVTFLLYGSSFNYKNIKVKCGMYEEKQINLVKSSIFSNLVCKTVFIPTKFANHNKIYIEGVKERECDNEVEFFRDSTVYPLAPSEAGKQ